jgi:hypothetical protein
MKNLMDYKTFEYAQSIGAPYQTTSEETLTNYYKCNDCGNLFYLFNDTTQNCKSCGKNNVNQITDFDYFAEMSKRDKETYKKEMSLKHKREERFVDLVTIGAYQNYKKNFN